MGSWTAAAVRLGSRPRAPNRLPAGLLGFWARGGGEGHSDGLLRALAARNRRPRRVEVLDAAHLYSCLLSARRRAAAQVLERAADGLG